MTDFSFYKTHGYQKLEGSFISAEEICDLENTIELAECLPHTHAWYNSIIQWGGTPSSIIGMNMPESPLYSKTLHNIVKRNAPIAAEIMGKKEVYVKQCKINMKTPGNNEDFYLWHADFTTWKARDRIRRPEDVVNITIFIDDVPEESGPLVFIPKTQTKEHIKIDLGVDGPIPNFVDDLNYVENLAKENGTVLATGKSGGAYAFNPNILHKSEYNTTNNPRRIIVIAYNSCDNLTAPKNRVPWYDSPHTENINT